MFDFFKGADAVENKIKCSAIIVAAGSSSRMNGAGSKQFMEVLDKPVLAHTLEAFEDCELISEVIIVTRAEDIMYCNDAIVQPFGFTKVTKIVVGGSERQYSVYNGLKEVSEGTQIVVIHDGARPLVTSEDIESSIYECMEFKAITTGVRVKDTIKVVNSEGIVVDTPNRAHLWATHTPQTFDYDLIIRAHEKAIEDEFLGTDDSILVERLGYNVKMVESSNQNIKVTTLDDIYVVESILDKDLS